MDYEVELMFELLVLLRIYYPLIRVESVLRDELVALGVVVTSGEDGIEPSELFHPVKFWGNYHFNGALVVSHCHLL